MDRINRLLRTEIAKIIQEQLTGQVGFVSITDVTTSKDLATSKVYYSEIGDDKQKEKTFRKLKQAAGFIKGELGRVVQFKRVPSLRFIYDPSLERGAHVVNELNKLNQ